MSDAKSLQDKMILLVEDDALQLQAARLPLLRRGYDVVAVESGEAAVDWLSDSEHAPDLVILDAMMPGLTGFDVCRALRANMATKDVPVIFLTARRSHEDMVEASNAGSDLYLMKPVIPSRLVNMAEVFLSSDGPLVRRATASSETAADLPRLAP
jgi:two-component system, OmpR family, phosphate regulon response regulator PhoB